MSKTTKLLITSLSEKKENTKNRYLGPWCSDTMNLLKNSEEFIFKTVHMPLQELIEDEKYCNELFERMLPKIALALNTRHNRELSIEFWRIILTNWFINQSNASYFYFKLIKKIENSKDNFIVDTDETIYFDRLEYPYALRGKDYYDIYLHSLISNIINYLRPDNVVMKKKKLDLKIGMTKIRKKVFFKSFFWWLLTLNKKKASTLAYGPELISHFNKFLILIFNRDIFFSYKNLIPINLNIKTSNLEIKFDYTNDFEKFFTQYISKSLPYTILDGFDNLLAQASDYKNKKIAIASQNYYIDEQLIELALVKENGGKILQYQNAGGASSKVSLLSSFLNRCLDVYLTSGWSETEGSRSKKTLPSQLFYKIYNKKLHKEKNENILYYSGGIKKYADIFDSVHRNDVKVLFNRHLFFKKINSSYLRNKYFLKEHPASENNLEKDIIENFYNCNIITLDDKNTTMYNCSFIIIDYIGTSYIQALISNTPFFMIIDYDIFTPTKQLKKYFDAFEKAGFLFQDFTKAAVALEDIYARRIDFWNSDNIQLIRKKFLSEFLSGDSDHSKKISDIFVDDIDKIKVLNEYPL